MSRSVYVPWDAYMTAYFSLGNEWFDDSGWIDVLFDSLKEQYPSLVRCNERFSEGVVLARNKIFDVVVSEYLGLVAVSLIANKGTVGNLIARVASEKKLGSAVSQVGIPLVPKGFASNGEQFFAPYGNTMINSYSSEDGWIF